MNEDYRQGFRDGMAYQRELMSDRGFSDLIQLEQSLRPESFGVKPKRKVKQSAKQLLLTRMTRNKWKKYKKGSGKKTYVQIRAEVSRSQAFKKAARRL